MNTSKLNGLKTNNLFIKKINGDKADIIYVGCEYNNCPVEYMSKCDYWAIDLPNGDAVMINNKLV